jgi:hypothetical protein
MYPGAGLGRTEDRCVMRLQVNDGWEPGITWAGKLYAPGETVEIPEDDARQFLDNGSASEAKPPRRQAK